MSAGKRWRVLILALLLAAPVFAGWEVRQETLGEGIPTWIATVQSRDNRLLFWVEYPTDGPCVPQVILKSDGWEAFAFDPARVENIATVIRFSREKLLQVPGYAGNGFIFEWVLEKEHFAEMRFGFAEEKEFLVSLPGREGEVTGTFGLEDAMKAIGEACAACEERYLADNDFVLPESSERLLEKWQAARLSPTMLRVARNEIFARHGRVFQDLYLEKHFKGKSWYKPVVGEPVLSEIEKANVALIAACE